MNVTAKSWRVPAIFDSTKELAPSPTWHPAQVGSDFEFKPVMQPLQAHRDQMVTISKLTAPWGESVHVGASSAFLNGIGPVIERGATGDSYSHLQSKKTLDQFIADHVAGDTPLHSIEVGTEDMGTAAGACDDWWYAMYSGSITEWHDPQNCVDSV